MWRRRDGSGAKGGRGIERDGVDMGHAGRKGGNRGNVSGVGT